MIINIEYLNLFFLVYNEIKKFISRDQGLLESGSSWYWMKEMFILNIIKFYFLKDIYIFIWYGIYFCVKILKGI